jgi:cytoskeleton protein RodZ
MVRFTTKKIDSLTLGEKMRKMREDRRLSLYDISKRTRIQQKYLEYIENGEYEKLPADVYVRGFLRSYAALMGVDEKFLVKQFEREKGIHRNIKKLPETETVSKPIKFSSLIITPKMIFIGVIIFLAIASFAYLYMEVNSFISAPRLVIIKPADSSSIDGNSTHVAGVTEKDALVFINDQSVLVNENGEFSEDVGLKSGLNTITVKSRNRFDKEAVKTVSITANFEEQAYAENIPNEIPEGQTENLEKISAEVFVNPNPTWLSVEADGNLVYSGVLLPQSVQTFEADNSLSITSGKGNETFVKINGKDLGALSNDPGAVRDAKFDRNGKVGNNKQ